MTFAELFPGLAPGIGALGATSLATTISAKPNTVSGRTRVLSSETGVRRKVTPSRRRSTTKIVPKNSIRERTWVASSRPQKLGALSSASLQDAAVSLPPLPRSV